MLKMCRFFCLVTPLIVLLARGSNSTLIRAPLNTAVIQQDTVTLNCTSNVSTSIIYWFNSTCARNASVDVCPQSDYMYNGYNTGQAPPRFSVTADNSNGQVTRNLNINPTQLSDAGVYECAEIVGGLVTASSSDQLVVLASNPLCTTNLSSSGDVDEFDPINFECSVLYSGNWPPVMRWQNDVTGQNYSGQVTNSSGRITFQLMITATSCLNGTKISCVIYFIQPSTPLTTTATNVPSYSDTWSSPTFNIRKLYVPVNVTCYPMKTVYQPGDVINCSADGYPSPTYQWIRLVNGSVTNGSILAVTDDMAGYNFTCMCTATNRVNGTTHSVSANISFSVERVTTTLTPTTTTTTTFSQAANVTTATAPAATRTTRLTSTDSASCSISKEAGESGYKGATIALAIIACVSVSVNVVLIIYMRRKTAKSLPQYNSAVNQSISDTTAHYNEHAQYVQIDPLTRNQPTLYDSLQAAPT